MDFVAIDFETATGHASSACQLAAVVVQNSEIAAEHCWYIRPPQRAFSPRNIAIHGIRPKDVVDAPTMAEVWNALRHVVEGCTIIAHNARFDVGVLIGSLAAHDIACPDLEFNCTRMLARCTWPGRARYGLKPLGDWLGVKFQHHDALEDARCCAQIALASETENGGIQELAALEEKLRVVRGFYRRGQLTSPRRIGRGRFEGTPRMSTDRWGFPSPQAPRGGIDAEAIVTAAAEQLPLAGKKIVLLGPLRGLDAAQSQQLIERLGGSCHRTLDASIDFVVACGTTLEEASQTVCQALAQAPEMPQLQTQRPGGIRLISERQFRALLPAGKATVRW